MNIYLIYDGTAKTDIRAATLLEVMPHVGDAAAKEEFRQKYKCHDAVLVSCMQIVDVIKYGTRNHDQRTQKGA